jgi:hypothetical protein
VKKRHHFIPQFYLRKFATLNPKEAICTSDMVTGECRASAANATAYETHCYSVTLPDGSRTDELENWISEVESKAAPILEKLIAGDRISEQEKADFAAFMALMVVRADSWRLMWGSVMTSGIQIANFATASRDDVFEKAMERYQRDMGKTLSEKELSDLKDAMLNPQKFKLEISKEWTIQAFKFYDVLFPLFFRMTWSILTNDTPRPLITSDNPVAQTTPGLADKDAEVVLPLSTTTCLIAHWRTDAQARGKLKNEAAVKMINRQQAYNALRFLFGPNRDEGILRLAEKYKDVRPGFKISGFMPPEFSPVSLGRGR